MDSVFYAGVVIYMVGFLITQVRREIGNPIRLIGSVVVIVGYLLAKGFIK